MNNELEEMMSDEEFLTLMDEFTKYLEKEKVFIQNPIRYAEVQLAMKKAKELFVDCEISIKDDPIQMGSLSICISGFDITVQGQSEIQLFTELIYKADNFEIYPVDDKIVFNILFGNVLTKIN